MDRTLVIEPGDAVKHGLPPVRITLDLNGLAIVPSFFIDPKTYVYLSGPPGGVRFFQIMTLPHFTEDGDALGALILELHADDPYFSYGERNEIEIHSVRYRSQLFFTGTGFAATAACAMIVPPPIRGASTQGLLLLFGFGATPKQVTRCSTIAKSEPFRKILDTMTLDLAIDPTDRKFSAANSMQ